MSGQASVVISQSLLQPGRHRVVQLRQQLGQVVVVLAIEMVQEGGAGLVHGFVRAALAATQTLVAAVAEDLAEETFVRVKPEERNMGEGLLSNPIRDPSVVGVANSLNTSTHITPHQGFHSGSLFCTDPPPLPPNPHRNPNCIVFKMLVAVKVGCSQQGVK